MDNFICTYDFETDGKDQRVCEPVQIAACMIHPKSLNIVENSEFVSYMQPIDINDEDYYEKHEDTIKWHAENYKTTPQEIFNTWKSAPTQKVVWKDFHTYLLKYNMNQSRKSKFSAPICAGANIVKFDNVITQRLCERYGMVSKEGEQKIFAPRDFIDITNLMFYWFENALEPDAYNMNSLRTFFGLDHDGSHDALKDVRDCSLIISKFLKLHRNLSSKIAFKGSCK